MSPAVPDGVEQAAKASCGDDNIAKTSNEADKSRCLLAFGRVFVVISNLRIVDATKSIILALRYDFTILTNRIMPKIGARQAQLFFEKCNKAYHNLLTKTMNQSIKL